jgi:hypothetical protein
MTKDNEQNYESGAGKGKSGSEEERKSGKNNL